MRSRLALSRKQCLLRAGIWLGRRFKTVERERDRSSNPVWSLKEGQAMEKRIRLREHGELRRHVDKFRSLQKKLERKMERLDEALRKHLVKFLRRSQLADGLQVVRVEVDLSEDDPEAIVRVESIGSVESVEDVGQSAHPTPSRFNWN